MKTYPPLGFEFCPGLCIALGFKAAKQEREIWNSILDFGEKPD